MSDPFNVNIKLLRRFNIYRIESLANSFFKKQLKYRHYNLLQALLIKIKLQNFETSVINLKIIWMNKLFKFRVIIFISKFFRVYFRVEICVIWRWICDMFKLIICKNKNSQKSNLYIQLCLTNPIVYFN